jgi:hypothetical protein
MNTRAFLLLGLTTTLAACMGKHMEPPESPVEASTETTTTETTDSTATRDAEGENRQGRADSSGEGQVAQPAPVVTAIPTEALKEEAEEYDLEDGLTSSDEAEEIADLPDMDGDMDRSIAPSVAPSGGAIAYDAPSSSSATTAAPPPSPSPPRPPRPPSAASSSTTPPPTPATRRPMAPSRTTG